MTENDTFRILARPKFEEMFEKHRAWWAQEGADTERNTSLRIPFMKQHGWTWLEFLREANARGIGNVV